MTEEQIKDAWMFIEGKAAGLHEADKPVNFPVLFAQYILEIAQLQRKWVGLTDEEIADLDCVRLDEIGYGDFALNEKSVRTFARIIESRLKKKNNG